MIKRLGALVVYAYFLIFLAVIMALSTYWNRTYATPEQPIAFPHDTHINVAGLDCADCHVFADQGRQATAPPVSQCMTCHETVKTESPEIQKLTQYWQEERPIEWAQINKLPEYVYFSHKRHVTKGISCQTCHGQVQAMHEVHKVRSFSMGFCVACHRQNDASVDCYTCHK